MLTGANPMFSMQIQNCIQRLWQSYYTYPSLKQISCVDQLSLVCYTTWRVDTCQQLTWKLAGEPERDCTFTPHFSGSNLNASSARFCSPHALCQTGVRKEKKRQRKEKAKAFRRQFDENPSIIPGCPGDRCYELMVISITQQEISLGLVKTE